jgi:ZIP family zinc transporter
MLSAFAWGCIAASSLLIGAVLALRWQVPSRLLGLIMGFGAGVLISAVSYDLVLEAFETSHGDLSVAFGLAAGALTFYAGDVAIDRLGGADRKSSRGAQAAGFGPAIVLGTVLDGIPESAVIGLSLLGGEGVSAAVLVAVFLSNLPEAIAATSGLSLSGWSPLRIMALWSAILVVSGLAAMAGYALLDGAAPRTIAFVDAFAGGAILTMLADSMMPEAFERGGNMTGLIVTLGFGLAFAVSMLG